MGPLWVAKTSKTFTQPSQKERGWPIEGLGAHTRHPTISSEGSREREGRARRRSRGLGSWKEQGRVGGGSIKVLVGDDHIRALPLLGAGGQLLAQGLL